MSLRALIWAFDSDVKSSGKKFVLVALADAANERAKTYLSMPALCKITAQSAGAVEANIEGLIQDGKITDTLKRVGEQNEIPVFQLNCETPATQAALIPPVKRERKPKNPLLAEAVKIYELYPRPIGRPKALQAITKAIKAYDFEIVMNGTKLFAESWKASGKTDLTFCPHGATFFNQERFNDPPEAWGLGTPKRLATGPAYPEVLAYCKEKESDPAKTANWAISFFNHWKNRKWMRGNIEIDWKNELQNQLGKWRQQT